jgi:hypothetical protein
MSPSPWGGTITLPLKNTAYQLSERLQALSPTQKPPFDLSTGMQFLSIQPNENGDETQYFIGNSNVSATFKGVMLFAAQVYPMYSMGSNIIRADHIYIMATADNQPINVELLQR